MDEVIVVDTGSVDATREIARARGAAVIEHPWSDDFAAARNFGLDAAGGEWILYIDADERLRPETDTTATRDRLAASADAAFRVGLRPFVHATPFLEYRLWRADPRIRFRGVIHEQVVEAIHMVAAEDGRSVSDMPELEIEHLGYEGDQSQKHERNLPLLRRSLEDEPEKIFNWRHLARVLEATGDLAGAENALEHAVALARSEAEPSSHGSLAWGDLVRLRHDRGADVSDLLAEGRAIWPDNWQLVWIEGNIHLDESRNAEAAARFRELLAVEPAAMANAGFAYDQRIFAVFSQSSLGLALFRLGDYAGAEAAYAAAAALDPANPEHGIKRALAASRARP